MLHTLGTKCARTVLLVTIGRGKWQRRTRLFEREPDQPRCNPDATPIQGRCRSGLHRGCIGVASGLVQVESEYAPIAGLQRNRATSLRASGFSQSKLNDIKLVPAVTQFGNKKFPKSAIFQTALNCGKHALFGPLLQLLKLSTASGIPAMASPARQEEWLSTKSGSETLGDLIRRLPRFSK
jgi:hypothetical protein